MNLHLNSLVFAILIATTAASSYTIFTSLKNVGGPVAIQYIMQIQKENVYMQEKKWWTQYNACGYPINQERLCFDILANQRGKQD